MSSCGAVFEGRGVPFEAPPLLHTPFLALLLAASHQAALRGRDETAHGGNVMVGRCGVTARGRHGVTVCWCRGETVIRAERRAGRRGRAT